MPVRIIYDYRQIPIAMAQIVNQIEEPGEYRCEYLENSETHDVMVCIYRKNVPTTQKRIFGRGKKEIVADKPLVKVFLRRDHYFAWNGSYREEDEADNLLLLELIAKYWEVTVAKGNQVTINVINVFEEELKNMFDDFEKLD